tara:strand:+ start:55472 stop:56071 length:600 start_codon:yes stop_codon:yes gene_type:complete
LIKFINSEKRINKMEDQKFINDYLNRYKISLFETDVEEEAIKMKELLLNVKDNGKKVIVAGNGGSAAMASHVAVDFTKQGGIRTVNFNETDLITCFANDYGYEYWVQKAVEFYGDKDDLLILISSSGTSRNMINAAKIAKSLGIYVVTFTGFTPNNPLKEEGELNFWLDSKAYNVVENTHQIWLLMICDLIIGNAEYSA